MKVEERLHAKVVAALYLFSGLLMLVLSVQNYRYGLYPLVYSASLIAALLCALAIYARFGQNSTDIAKAGVWGLGFCFLLITKDSMAHPIEVKHWAFPIGLLSFIALKHRTAMLLTVVAAVVLTLALISAEGLVRALSFATSYALLIALASTYAQLHQQQGRTLVELETRDPMTRAYNYRYLEETLEKELCRADRTGKPLSLIALEIDYFPQVNDVHGPLVANDLLSQFASQLHAMIRAGDSVYYSGKQAFYLLLPCTPAEGVVVIAERIRRTIADSNWPVVDSITVSLGCSSYLSTERDCKVNSFINDANVALIEAQKNGHNRVCHHGG